MREELFEAAVGDGVLRGHRGGAGPPFSIESHIADVLVVLDAQSVRVSRRPRRAA